MKYRLTVLLLMCNIATIYAQDVPIETNVPESVKKQIGRLGNYTQVVGESHGATVDDAIMDAFKTPENDNYKWYFTLFVDNKPGTKELTTTSAALKRDIESSEVFAPWVDAINREKSPVHYNVRNLSSDADLHKDFTRNIREQIGELPCILIQPPRNGEFGKNETVVGILHLPNYKHGEEKEVVNTLKQLMINYITVKFNNGELTNYPRNKLDGHEQQGLEFLDKPSGKRSPYRTTPDGAAQPRRLTLDDIEVLVPDAPRDFVQHCYKEQLSRDEIVQLWQDEQIDTSSRVVHTIKDEQDFQAATHQTFMTLILVCMLGIGVFHTYMMYRQRKDAKQLRTLTETEHKFLVDVVKRFDTANNPETKS